MPTMHWRPGRAPDPTGGAHDDPPDLLVGWGGDTPSPRTSPPRRLFSNTPLGTGPPIG